MSSSTEPLSPQDLEAIGEAGLAAWLAETTSYKATFSFDGRQCEACRTRGKDGKLQLDIYRDGGFVKALFVGDPALEGERINKRGVVQFSDVPSRAESGSPAATTAAAPGLPASAATTEPPINRSTYNGPRVVAITIPSNIPRGPIAPKPAQAAPAPARAEAPASMPPPAPTPVPTPRGAQRQSELIEPVKFADAMASIARLTESDPAADAALDMLARSDANDFQIEDALKLIAKQTKYSIKIVRDTFKPLRRRAGHSVSTETHKPWQEHLVYRDVEMIKPAGGVYNTGLVIKFGELFNQEGQTIFGRNEFSLKIEVLGELSWNKKFPREIEQNDLDNIEAYCQKWDIPASGNAVFKAVSLAAADRRFNPVVDFLNACAEEWDRKPRLDLMLTTYCGVEDTPLARACGSRWMISAVARAEKPGCQVDCMLVLEGAQGAFKSSFFRILGEPHFVDQISDLGDKDSLIETAGAWIIELAELDAMRKADVSRIKKYLAFRSDRYRPPFERLVTDVPRRCVFAGTINPDGEGAPYLRDTTGGRRFWCFYSPGVDLDAVKRDVRQLWGEAVHRYRAGERWWLHEPGLQKDAATVIESRTDFGINEAMEALMVPWLEARNQVTVAEILRGVFHTIDVDIPRAKSAQMDVANILKRHGYVRKTSTRPPHWIKGV